jgi:hypothetical protein
MFRFSIMFFSFFDLISCITIFWLIHRMSPPVGAGTRTAASAPA